MITTICLLILIYAIMGRPMSRLVEKLENADWKNIARDAWDRIAAFSKKAGRRATGMALKFYYAMTEGKLSTMEKALVYAGIIYIVVPSDLLPRKIMGLLGALDDVGVAAWIYNKVGDAITPEIERKVEETLDDWFGPEVVTEFIVSFDK